MEQEPVFWSRELIEEIHRDQVIVMRIYLHLDTMLPHKEHETESGQPAPATKTMVLKVMVYKHGYAYIAECLDLDIVVREKTENRASKSLRQAVRGYLKVAYSGDPAGLVPRPAPWTHYLRYYLSLCYS